MIDYAAWQTTAPQVAPAGDAWFGPSTTVPIEEVPGGKEYLDFIHGDKDKTFLQALFTKEQKDIPFAGDWMESFRLADLYKTQNKIAKGERVSNEDLVAYNMYMAQLDHMDDAPFGEKAGNMLRDSTVFWAEIGLTALASAATGVGAGVLVPQRIAQKKGIKTLKKQLSKSIARKLAKKIGGRNAIKVGRAAAIAVDLNAKALAYDVVRSGGVMSNYQQRKIGQMLNGTEDEKNAFLLALGDTHFEHVSEMTGEYLGAVTRKILKKTGATRLINEVAEDTVLGNLIDRFHSPGAKAASDAFQMAGINNVLEEMGEERVGGFLRGLWGIDSEGGLKSAIKKSGWEDPEHFWLEAVTFSVPGMVRMSAQYAMSDLTGGVAPHLARRHQRFVDNISQPVQTKEEIDSNIKLMKTGLDQSSGSPWFSKFGPFAKYNTKRGSLEALLQRRGIVGMYGAYEKAKQKDMNPEEAIKKYMVEGMGVIEVDSKEAKDQIQGDLTLGRAIVGEKKERPILLYKKEFLTDQDLIELATETDVGVIVDINDRADFEIGDITVGILDEPGSIEQMFGVSGIEASKMKNILKAKLQDKENPSRIIYELPIILSGTKDQLENDDMGTGYVVPESAKPYAENKNGDKLYAMWKGAGNSNELSTIYLNQFSNLQDISEDTLELTYRQNTGDFLTGAAISWNRRLDHILDKKLEDKSIPESEKEDYRILKGQTYFERFLKAYRFTRMGFTPDARNRLNTPYNRINDLAPMTEAEDYHMIEMVGEEMLNVISNKKITMPIGPVQAGVLEKMETRTDTAGARALAEQPDISPSVVKLREALAEDMRYKESRENVIKEIERQRKTGTYYSLHTQQELLHAKINQIKQNKADLEKHRAWEDLPYTDAEEETYNRLVEYDEQILAENPEVGTTVKSEDQILQDMSNENPNLHKELTDEVARLDDQLNSIDGDTDKDNAQRFDIQRQIDALKAIMLPEPTQDLSEGQKGISLQRYKQFADFIEEISFIAQATHPEARFRISGEPEQKDEQGFRIRSELLIPYPELEFAKNVFTAEELQSVYPSWMEYTPKAKAALEMSDTDIVGARELTYGQLAKMALEELRENASKIPQKKVYRHVAINKGSGRAMQEVEVPMIPMIENMRTIFKTIPLSEATETDLLDDLEWMERRLIQAIYRYNKKTAKPQRAVSVTRAQHMFNNISDQQTRLTSADMLEQGYAHKEDVDAEKIDTEIEDYEYSQRTAEQSNRETVILKTLEDLPNVSMTREQGGAPGLAKDYLEITETRNKNDMVPVTSVIPDMLETITFAISHRARHAITGEVSKEDSLAVLNDIFRKRGMLATVNDTAVVTAPSVVNDIAKKQGYSLNRQMFNMTNMSTVFSQDYNVEGWVIILDMSAEPLMGYPLLRTLEAAVNRRYPMGKTKAYYSKKQRRYIYEHDELINQFDAPVFPETGLFGEQQWDLFDPGQKMESTAQHAAVYILPVSDLENKRPLDMSEDIANWMIKNRIRNLGIASSETLMSGANGVEGTMSAKAKLDWYEPMRKTFGHLLLHNDSPQRKEKRVRKYKKAIRAKYQANIPESLAVVTRKGEIILYDEAIQREWDSGLPYLRGERRSKGSQQKGVVFRRIDISKFIEALGTVENFKKFIRLHEEGHIKNGDLGVYPKNWLSSEAILMERKANKYAFDKMGIDFNSLRPNNQENYSLSIDESDRITNDLITQAGVDDISYSLVADELAHDGFSKYMIEKNKEKTFESYNLLQSIRSKYKVPKAPYKPRSWKTDYQPKISRKSLAKMETPVGPALTQFTAGEQVSEKMLPEGRRTNAIDYDNDVRLRDLFGDLVSVAEYGAAPLYDDSLEPFADILTPEMYQHASGYIWQNSMILSYSRQRNDPKSLLVVTEENAYHMTPTSIRPLEGEFVDMHAITETIKDIGEAYGSASTLANRTTVIASSIRDHKPTELLRKIPIKFKFSEMMEKIISGRDVSIDLSKPFAVKATGLELRVLENFRRDMQSADLPEVKHNKIKASDLKKRWNTWIDVADNYPLHIINAGGNEYYGLTDQVLNEIDAREGAFSRYLITDKLYKNKDLYDPMSHGFRMDPLNTEAGTGLGWFNIWQYADDIFFYEFQSDMFPSFFTNRKDLQHALSLLPKQDRSVEKLVDKYKYRFMEYADKKIEGALKYRDPALLHMNLFREYIRGKSGLEFIELLNRTAPNRVTSAVKEALYRKRENQIDASYYSIMRDIYHELYHDPERISMYQTFGSRRRGIEYNIERGAVLPEWLNNKVQEMIASRSVVDYRTGVSILTNLATGQPSIIKLNPGGTARTDVTQGYDEASGKYTVTINTIYSSSAYNREMDTAKEVYEFDNKNEANKFAIKAKVAPRFHNLTPHIQAKLYELANKYKYDSNMLEKVTQEVIGGLRDLISSYIGADLADPAERKAFKTSIHEQKRKYVALANDAYSRIRKNRSVIYYANQKWFGYKNKEALTHIMQTYKGMWQRYYDRAELVTTDKINELLGKQPIDESLAPRDYEYVDALAKKYPKITVVTALNDAKQKGYDYAYFQTATASTLIQGNPSASGLYATPWDMEQDPKELEAKYDDRSSEWMRAPQFKKHTKVGPLYAVLSKMKNIKIDIHKPSWSNVELVRVDLSNYFITDINYSLTQYTGLTDQTQWDGQEVEKDYIPSSLSAGDVDVQDSGITDETYSLYSDVMGSINSFHLNNMRPQDRTMFADYVTKALRGENRFLDVIWRNMDRDNRNEIYPRLAQASNANATTQLDEADQEDINLVEAERQQEMELDETLKEEEQLLINYDHEDDISTEGRRYSLSLYEDAFDNTANFYNGAEGIHKILIDQTRKQMVEQERAYLLAESWAESIGLLNTPKDFTKEQQQAAQLMMEGVKYRLDNPRAEYIYRRRGKGTKNIPIDKVFDKWDNVRKADMPTAQQMIDTIRPVLEKARESANEYVESLTQEAWINYVEDYIARHYLTSDVPVKELARKITEQSKHAKKRRFETFEQARKEMNLIPQYIGADESYKRWASNVWIAARNRMFFNLTSLVRDSDGTPVVIPVKEPGVEESESAIITPIIAARILDNLATSLGVEYDANVDPMAEIARISASQKMEDHGYTRMDSPYTSDISYFWVQDGKAKKIMAQVIGRPFEGRFIDIVEKYNAYTKFAQLSFSLFHAFALIESLIGMFGVTMRNPANPWNWGKSWKDLKNTMAEVRGDEKKWVPWISSGLRVGLSNPDIKMGHVDRLIEGNLERLEGTEGALSAVGRTGLKTLLWYKEKVDKFLWQNLHPAIKLYTAESLKNEIELREDRELQPQEYEDISRLVNNAFGGQEWESYMWATPHMRQLMHLIAFAPDWTLSAANISGITTWLPGAKGIVQPNMSALEKKLMIRKYWPAMILYVLHAMPNMAQLGIYLFAKAAGQGDPDDHPFNFQNEPGKKTHIDITPLARMLGYSGDLSGKRRVYMRFGKQVYEVFEGWLNNFNRTLYAKTSNVVKLAIEQSSGMNIPFGQAFPFKDASYLGLLSAEGDVFKGRVAHEFKRFLPMSIVPLLKGQPSSFIAPVSRGASMGTVVLNMRKVLRAYADPSVWDRISGEPEYVFNLETLLADQIEQAERNGINAKQAFERARSYELAVVYKKFFNELNKGKHTKRLDRIAESVLRLKANTDDVHNSIESRLKNVNRPYDYELEAIADSAIREAY